MHIGTRTPLPRRPGLGQLAPMAPIPSPAPATVPGDPLYARLLASNLGPIVGALSSRIAYGGGGGYGGYQQGWGSYLPYGGGGGQFGFGGISQTTLLFGALALGAVLILKR